MISNMLLTIPWQEQIPFPFLTLQCCFPLSQKLFQVLLSIKLMSHYTHAERKMQSSTIVHGSITMFSSMARAVPSCWMSCCGDLNLISFRAGSKGVTFVIVSILPLDKFLAFTCCLPFEPALNLFTGWFLSSDLFNVVECVWVALLQNIQSKHFSAWGHVPATNLVIQIFFS